MAAKKDIKEFEFGVWKVLIDDGKMYIETEGVTIELYKFTASNIWISTDRETKYVGLKPVVHMINWDRI